MSKKTLMVLVAVFAVLAGATWMARQRTAESFAPAAGGRLLPAVDINTIRAIALEEGAATAHLAQVDGIWCVAEQANYPADIGHLREMMRSIDEAENVQIAEEGTEHLADYGLAADGNSAPLKITLEHGNGTTVLRLGKMREPRSGEGSWLPPAGRYAQVDDGPVLLLKEDVRMAQSGADAWWDRSLLEVPPESIRQVEVASAEGAFAVERGTNGTFALAGATEGETVDAAVADRLFGALRNLRAEKILSNEESAEAGFTNAVSCQAETEDATYRILMGAARSDQGGARPIKIEVSALSAATPEQQSAAAAAARKLGHRTFLVPAYAADALGLKRAELVRKPEAVPEPPPVPADHPSEESAAP